MQLKMFVGAVIFITVTKPLEILNTILKLKVNGCNKKLLICFCKSVYGIRADITRKKSVTKSKYFNCLK